MIPRPPRSTLSLHDALPISRSYGCLFRCWSRPPSLRGKARRSSSRGPESYWSHQSVRTSPRKRRRSEEHTSELQSLTNLVCRLLLEKKKHKTTEVGT